MLDLTGKGGPCNNNNDKNKDLWSFPELMRGDSVLSVQDCSECSSLQDRGCCERNMDMYEYVTFFTSLLGIFFSVLVMIMSL